MICLTATDRLRTILCLGAHSDDIEIGCGGTILRLVRDNPGLHVHWVVFGGADPRRAQEARASAAWFLQGVEHQHVQIATFRDAYMQFAGAEVKDYFESIKKTCSPDLIFTHYRDDRHQDHRLLSDLAWNTWRDHMILEYEILKYDGDLGHPNIFSPLSEEICQKKIDLLMSAFPTQAGRQWFTEDTFRAMLRIRGVEANSHTKYAEAFYSRKMML